MLKPAADAAPTTAELLATTPINAPTAGSAVTGQVTGLTDGTAYKIYFLAQATSPPTVNFYAYLLSGSRIDQPNQDLYRMFEDASSLTLAPNSSPLNTAIESVNVMGGPSGAASTLSPAFAVLMVLLLATLSAFKF